jgi:histidyl-tRNA synthetase
LACDDEGVFAAPSSGVDVFVVDTTGGLEAVRITGALRAAGIRCDRAYENRSMKSQMKVADRSGAAYAVIVGTNELEAGTVVVRPLRAERPAGQGDAPAVSGQYDVARHDLIDHLTKALS